MHDCLAERVWRDPRARRWCGVAALAVLLISCQTTHFDRGIDRALVVEDGAAKAVVPGRHGLFRIDGDSRLEPANVQRVTLTNRHPVPVFVRLTRPGWPDLTSAETILASIHDAGMTDKEKALAIFEFVKAWRIHWWPPSVREERFDPMKVVGVYGYGHCGETARVVEQLARRAGLGTRVWELNGHIVSEIYFDGRWHIVDADMGKIYDHPDGYLAGVEDLEADPSLDRTYGYLYSSTHDNVISPAVKLFSHNLALKLAPGDAAIFEKKPLKYLPPSLKEIFVPSDPEFSHQEFFVDASGIRRYLDDPSTTWAVGRLVTALSAGQSHVEVPYAILEGRLRAKTCCVQGRVAFGSLWAHTAHGLPVDGSGLLSNFSQLVVAQPAPPYMVWLDVNVPTELELTFQFAPQSIPWLEGGERQFEVVVAPALPNTRDGLSGSVEVVYEWDQVEPVVRFNLSRLDGHADGDWEVSSDR